MGVPERISKVKTKAEPKRSAMVLHDLAMKLPSEHLLQSRQPKETEGEKKHGSWFGNAAGGCNRVFSTPKLQSEIPNGA